jgi:hypothetical protein
MNKAYHEGFIPNAFVVSFTINKTILEHHAAWKNTLAISREVRMPPSHIFFKINYDTAIRDTFFVEVAVCRDSEDLLSDVFILLVLLVLLVLPVLPILQSMVKLLQLFWHPDWRLLRAYPILSWKVIDSLMVTQALQLPAITQDWRIASTIFIIYSTIPPFTSLTAHKINEV